MESASSSADEMEGGDEVTGKVGDCGLSSLAAFPLSLFRTFEVMTAGLVGDPDMMILPEFGLCKTLADLLKAYEGLRMY